MKLLVLCSLVVAAAAWPSFDLDGYQSDTPGTPLAKKQQDVNHLLEHVYDHLHYKDLKDLAGTFSPEADTSLYTDDGAAVHALLEELKDGRLLEQHHWFSLFNTRQREEALLLFEVLIHCRTWEGFLDNAAYFRERVNEGEFVYALYVAVIHSDLGHGIVLPPLYEVTPHLFTNSEIINKAYSAKMTQTPGKFHMDFTGTKKNKEQRVAYFGEDIGMNIHHVTWHMDFPFWWKDSYGYHLDRKGELFFWVHHQLTARFDSERLSNWLDVVDEIHWEKVIHEGFAPHTSYKYGGEFPARPDNVHFEDVDGVARVRDMVILESRIRDAIALGYITDKSGNHIDIRNEHGIDLLGDIIESSVYSPNAQYYGALHNTAHIMLGRQGDPHGKFDMPPGVMEHFETATRDPSFFRLHKYMDNLFKEHKDSLPPYTKSDIEFPGVVVDSVAIDGELKTFFDTFEFSLVNAVDKSDNVADVDISADVKRLNHEEFSYNIDISNNNGNKVLGTIRIFLCPLKDSNGVTFTWEEGHWYCIEMDKFYKSLAPGTNHVVRKSVDSSVTVPDRLSFEELKKRTDAAVTSGSKLDLHEFERSCGIPNRLLLPKGKERGMDFALFVGVTNGDEDKTVDNPEELGATHAQCGIHGEKYPDKRPMGYPVDRRVPDNRVFLETPNIKRVYVKVFHGEHQ
ncbi:hemocyanin B chain-like [Procambarus clarkii]|uniref:hemocyanin B chain-like n=1 Tax=Procambarus clarkii TaxID=6728 RepID=UPI003742F23C